MSALCQSGPTRRSKKHLLFDHLVGAAGHGQRDCDAERLGGLEVQEQFNFRDLRFHLLLGRVYDDKDMQERIVRRSKLRPASIGLPKNGDDGRVGEARRITFAVINVTDNVRGELSAHVITVSELNRQKIARAIECHGHDAESVGIIDTTDVVRRDHSLYLTVAKDISSPQSENKKRAISHPQMRSTINSTNPIPTSSTASATESYSSQCR